MKQNTVFLTVEPGDIYHFGDTIFWPEENNGNTAFVLEEVGNKDWNMSFILLRNILRAIGPEYKVWRVEDIEGEGESNDIIFYTNLPQNVYEEACKLSVLNSSNPDKVWVNTFSEGSLLWGKKEDD